MRFYHIIHTKHSQKPSKIFGEFAEKVYLCGVEQSNQRKRNTMEQNDYLEFSEDGRTVIGCKKNYKGAVVITEGVTEIGENAFKGCTRLTSIEIPNSVTVIGNYAFYGCTHLTSIEIPDSVTRIGYHAFGGCMSLNSIEIPDSVTEIDAYTFSGCTNLNSIEIPDSVTMIKDWTFGGCTSLTSIEIPDSVTKIGFRAFSRCSSITSIMIPDSVIEIGKFAFYGCICLTKLHLRHKKPIDLNAMSFTSLDLSKITLYVPIGTGYAYRHHPFYSKFKEVVIER